MRHGESLKSSAIICHYTYVADEFYHAVMLVAGIFQFAHAALRYSAQAGCDDFSLYFDAPRSRALKEALPPLYD